MSPTVQLLEAAGRAEQRDGTSCYPCSVEREPGPALKAERDKGLRTRVLFPAARRLRRRRWAMSSAVVLAALAASALAYAVARHTSATTPSKSVTSYSLSGPAVARPWVYFRPVECLIAPPAGSATNRAAPALAMSGRPGTSSAAEVCQLSAAQQANYPTTVPGKDNPKAVVVLPYYSSAPYYISGIGRYVLGPVEMNASVVKTATAFFDPQVGSWEVNITFTSAGSAEFNRYAAQHYACYEKEPTDPPYCALQAIEINGVVEAAPAIEAGSFPGGATIAGSASNPFTKAQAESVASLVRTASKLASRPASPGQKGLPSLVPGR